MLKKMFFLILMPYGLQAMHDLAATAGTLSSVAGYYYLAKAMDINNEFPERTKEYDAAKAFNYKMGAGLKIISLAIDVPRLMCKSHWPLIFVVGQQSAIYCGIGIYNIEDAYKKYREYQRTGQEFHCKEAEKSLFLGMVFTILGGYTLACYHKAQGED